MLGMYLWAELKSITGMLDSVMAEIYFQGKFNPRKRARKFVIFMCGELKKIVQSTSADGSMAITTLLRWFHNASGIRHVGHGDNPN